MWHCGGHGRRSAAALLGMLVGIGSACADTPDVPPPADPAARSGAVSTEFDSAGGIPRATNRGEPPVLKPTLVLQVGDGASDDPLDPELFGRVRSVLPGPDGTLWVADSQAGEIRVFGSDGTFLHRVGRPGQGPGEFGSLYSMAWMGDTLVALDPANLRMGLFSAEGTWLGQWPASPITGDVHLHVTGPREFHAVVVRSREGREATTGFVRYTEGQAADTIPRDRPVHAPETAIVCELPDGGLRFFSLPFAPAYQEWPAPEGVRIRATTDRYTLARVAPGGDTLGLVVVERPPVRVDRQEWEAGMAGYRQFAAENPGLRCEGGSPSPPENRPRLRYVFFDDTGRLWVEALTPTGHRLELFGPRGELRAALNLPERDLRVPPAIVGNRIAWVVRDSLDLQAVQLYSLPPLP